jgi:hypothetical protein
MIQKLKQVLVRSLGVIMFAFIPGAAVGAGTVGWVAGGFVGVATVFSSIIIFFGVQLAWDASLSDADIEKGFRAAVAKQSAENKSVAEAVKTSKLDAQDLTSFGDLSELFDDK